MADHTFCYEALFPPPSLSWKHNLLARHHLGHVQVEEVAVQNRLDNTGHDSNDVIEAFEMVAVDPVEDVEGTV